MARRVARPRGISGDGRIIAYRSFATNLVQVNVNGVPQAYAHDRVTGVTVCVSRSVTGDPGDNDSGYLRPAVSSDGSVIAFVSTATNLGPTSPGTFVRGGTFLGPGGTGGGGRVCAGDLPYDPIPDDDPVTFSVNGPVDPQTEGIRDARGLPPTPPAGPQPGNMLALGVRTGPLGPPFGPVARALGLPTIWPGDVNDYDVAGVPSEAVMFQSPPFPPALPVPAPPDGTNNQILEAIAMGLAAGTGVPPPS